MTGLLSSQMRCTLRKKIFGLVFDNAVLRLLNLNDAIDTFVGLQSSYSATWLWHTFINRVKSSSIREQNHVFKK